jgi:putative intracellular protease/amidase
MDELKGLKVAILVEDGFEQVELTKPQKALDVAGADTRSSRPAGNRSAPGTSGNGARSFPSTSRSRGPQPRTSTPCSCRAA